MATCSKLYEIWKRRGNFCQKSEITAKQIECYISYVDKYKLQSFEINRCALYPFQMIEDKKILHARCLQELKKVIRKIGGKNITRRLSIEIISKVNEEIDVVHRITSIPTVRSRLGEHQHDIGNVSCEVRDFFDKLKSEIGVKNNNDFIAMMINYCSKHKDEMEKARDMMKGEPDRNIQVVKEN